MWNLPEFEMTLTLIRHGETWSNAKKRYLGTTDEGLSEAGIRHIQQIQTSGLYPVTEPLFVSPMLRCRQTAKLLFPGVAYQIVPQWREIDFGRFEGKTYRELSKTTEYQAWLASGGTLPFPEGESREQFIRRSVQGFAEEVKTLCDGSRERLSFEMCAVVHGGTIMALMSVLSGGEYFDFQVGCGEGYGVHLIHDGHKFEVLESKRLCGSII